MELHIESGTQTVHHSFPRGQNSHSKSFFENAIVSEWRGHVAGIVLTFSMNGGNGGGDALSVRSLINNTALSKARRALLGAAVLKGELNLKPTAKDVARMVGCSTAYLHAAAKLSPAEAQQVRAHVRPLMEPRAKALPKPKSPEERLADIVAEQGVNATLAMLAAIERGAAAA